MISRWQVFTFDSMILLEILNYDSDQPRVYPDIGKHQTGMSFQKKRGNETIPLF